MGWRKDIVTKKLFNMRYDSRFIKSILKHVRQRTLMIRLRTIFFEFISTLNENRRKKASRKKLLEWNFLTKDLNEVFVNIRPNVQMKLYSDGWLSKLIFCDDYEWQERQFLNQILKPGDIFIDVGANIGLYTLIASSLVGEKGQVYSFEPTSKVFQRLVDNIKLNNFKNVCCKQYALSDIDSDQEMNISLTQWDAWNSLSKPSGGGAYTTESINCMRWDKFSYENNLIGRIKMVKIDVEGWELKVLLGGYDVFIRDDAPILQLEFNDSTLEAAGTSCRELYTFLNSIGYQLFIYNAFLKKLVPDPIRDTSYYGANLIALKRPERFSFALRR